MPSVIQPVKLSVLLGIGQSPSTTRLQRWLAVDEHRVVWSPTAGGILDELASDRCDVAVVDIDLFSRQRCHQLVQFRRRGVEIPLLALSSAGSVQSAVAAAKLRACDFIVLLGQESEEVVDALQRAVDQRCADKQQALELQRLRREHERYTAMVEATQDGTWDWDTQTNQVSYCTRWIQMLGLTQEVVSNSLHEWFGRIHADDFPRVISLTTELLRGQRPDFAAQYRIKHACGDYLWAQCYGKALFGDDGSVERLVGSQRDITEFKQNEQRLTHEAMHDSLTALPNRALFNDRLRHAFFRLRRNVSANFAVLFVDLDRFKSVNDRHGHAAGDELLVHVAKQLQRCVRKSDTLARFGGDEFVILAENCPNADPAERLAVRIQQALISLASENGGAPTTASIGIALSSADYVDETEILRDADAAMYRAKAGGKARYEVFARSLPRRTKQAS